MRLTRSHALRLALAAGAVSLLPSCALLSSFLGSSFKKPTLTFVRAELKEVSLEAATLDLVFDVENQNDVELDLAKVSYKLEIEAKELVSGTPPNGVKIPARGKGPLTFPAHVKFADLAASLEAALTKEESAYRASGIVGVNSPIGIVELPLSAEGKFKNPRLPKFALDAPKVSGVGLTGARLTVPVRIENPNAFPLPVGGLSGTITLAGATIGTATGGGSTVAAGQATAIDLGVDVSFLSAGAAVAKTIADGAGEVKVEGALSIAGLSLPVQLSQKLTFTK